MDKVISVIFVTYNRKALLYEAIKAAEGQSYPVQLIVMDDCSTDGTEEMVKMNFPDISYYRSERNYGPSYQRNKGASKAVSEIIFFLDDDTILKDQSTIETTLVDFDESFIGAVTIPFVNILQNDLVQNGSPFHEHTYIYHSFVAAAFAVRKGIFIELGGFREEYFFMGEEGDFCVRLLEAGFYVKGGKASPAFHFQPVNRVSFLADFYGRRNDILFIYLNFPGELLIIYILAKTVSGVLYGLKVRRLKNMVMGIWAGLILIFKNEMSNQRRPVSYEILRKFKYLKAHEPVLLSDLK